MKKVFEEYFGIEFTDGGYVTLHWGTLAYIAGLSSMVGVAITLAYQVWSMTQ